jgi:hypothetical protein
MWKKSSFSGQAGTCVEVDLFKKSTHSVAGDCVEVAGGDTIRVRHSQRPDAEVIAYSPDEWQAFIDGVKAGEFDLP